MEQLAVRSFLDHGHPFHLYAYEEIDNVPAGAVVHRGDEILPEREIFRCPAGFGEGSVAAFADLFRYKLLLERGGWWADMDAVCIRPLDFAESHVVGRERSPDGGGQINNAIIKAPIGSPLMEYCWQQGRVADRGAADVGSTRPAALDPRGRGGRRVGADSPAGCLLPDRLLGGMAVCSLEGNPRHVPRDSPVECAMELGTPRSGRRLQPRLPV